MVIEKLLALFFVPAIQHFPIGLEQLLRLLAAHPVDEIRAVRLVFGAREGVDRAVENPVKRVVVGRWNGVEFVVVAARTADRESQKSLAHIVDRVFDHDVPQMVRTDADAARGGDVAGPNRLLPALVVVTVGQ